MVDDHISTEEEANIIAVANNLYKDKAENIIEVARKACEFDRNSVSGKIPKEKIMQVAKDVVAAATAAGVTIAVVGLAGSVSGLSAVGMTTGLAELGLGGICYLSAMATGIGAVAVIGIATFVTTRRVIKGKDNNKNSADKKPAKEFSKFRIEARAAMLEDWSDIVDKLEKIASGSEPNNKEVEKFSKLNRLYFKAKNIVTDDI